MAKDPPTRDILARAQGKIGKGHARRKGENYKLITENLGKIFGEKTIDCKEAHEDAKRK